MSPLRTFVGSSNLAELKVKNRIKTHFVELPFIRNYSFWDICNLHTSMSLFDGDISSKFQCGSDLMKRKTTQIIDIFKMTKTMQIFIIPNFGLAVTLVNIHTYLYHKLYLFR